ncbi:5-hydroxytryptamine receptor 6-like [Saccostrea cucullata]|uniref:5-hydroxytryptamine receptor 6-like n=1 Tax=Saccostrea cuccullata TaxID=36930 RepID=UPI002ED02F2E
MESVLCSCGCQRKPYMVFNDTDVILESATNWSKTTEKSARANSFHANAETIVLGVFLFLLIFLTILGNSLVLLAMIVKKKLRTVSNMFIVSLSLTDFLLGSIVMIPSALQIIFQEWIFQHEFCSVWVSFDVMLSSASVLNVCLISIDRYISILTPLRYKTVMTFQKAFLMLIIAWSIAILSSFVPIMNGLHNPDVPSLKNLTLFSSTPQCLFIISGIYGVIATPVTILCPIIIAIVLYYRVSKEAKRQAFFVGTLLTPGNVLLRQHVPAKHLREPLTRKATVTLGTIVGAYVTTWSPFLCANIVEGFCQCIPGKLFTAFVWLGYCNSLINPIIYPLFMKDFRKVYVLALSKCCPFLHKIKHFRIEHKLYEGIKHPTL